MSNKEFQELRKVIIGLNNPKITKNFNNLFNNDVKTEVEAFVNPINKDIIINVPERISINIEKVMVKHAPEISKVSKGGTSITNAPKWISSLISLFNDFSKVINR